MVVFELYGCPGCGKSTLINETAVQLKKRGIPFLLYDDVYFGARKGKLGKLLLYTKVILDPRDIPLKLQLLELGRRVGSQKKYILYLLTLCHQLRRLARDQQTNVVLLEEGVVQFVTSMYHGSLVEAYSDAPQLMERIKKHCVPIYAVNCNLPLNENIDRLRQRGSAKMTRFLKANDSQLALLMAEKRANLDYTAEYFHLLASLDMHQPVTENAAILQELITKQL